uniref:MARVEL domain-containing protein n=1 Tax=Castor canadensis TaxID=51338 RepID=A0A8C0ZXR9_CASCN
ICIEFYLPLIASIFAFATCGGFKGKTEIQVSCEHSNKTNITAAFGYPFRLNQASFQSPPNVNVCDVNWNSHVLIGDYSSSAQFYVTFAVFVFLYCIAALLLYVGYTNLYRDSRKLPMIIFGFLNMILWGGNAWFVYKETSLHSPSNTSASHGQGGLYYGCTAFAHTFGYSLNTVLIHILLPNLFVVQGSRLPVLTR